MTLFEQATTVMENAFRRLEAQVPPPRKKPCKDSFVYRYIEETIEQALIQKLARVISGLRAANVLLSQGFVQEQAVLHRTFDELNEDIMFLVVALTNETVTELHKQYLSAFYAEDFADFDDPVRSLQKRAPAPRKKIRAYLARVLGSSSNPSRDIAVSKTISDTYSGFVHAASPHIMDMCAEIPPKFYLSGMLGTPRVDDYREDLWNYHYRALCSTSGVAKAFGDKSLVHALTAYLNKFEQAFGKNYSGAKDNPKG